MNTLRKFFLISFYTAICFLTACGRTIPASEQQAKILTKDKVILIGKFVPPKKPGKFTFILLHGLASNKGEWHDFADKLSELGYGYLAVDMRGHGESNKATDGTEVNVKYFSWPGPESEWEAMGNDVGVIVKYLIKKKGTQENTIAFAGASIGANIALIYAAKHKSVPLVVLLSPGINYARFLSEPAMKEYGNRPAAIVASPDDNYAYESSRRLMIIAKESGDNAKFFEGKKAQHGVQMFDGKFEFKILEWIDSVYEGYRSKHR